MALPNPGGSFTGTIYMDDEPYIASERAYGHEECYRFDVSRTGANQKQLSKLWDRFVVRAGLPLVEETNSPPGVCVVAGGRCHITLQDPHQSCPGSETEWSGACNHWQRQFSEHIHKRVSKVIERSSAPKVPHQQPHPTIGSNDDNHSTVPTKILLYGSISFRM
eukprot:6476221-Amphidinium_carterae.1